jgi:hypothetical protein
MDLKEVAQRAGLKVNTAKTYIYRLKKKGFGVGRRVDNRLEFDEREIEVLKEVAQTSVKDFLEKHKIIDIVPTKKEIAPERFLGELAKRDMMINELLARVEALETQITQMQNRNLWNRIKRFFSKK